MDADTENKTKVSVKQDVQETKNETCLTAKKRNEKCEKCGSTVCKNNNFYKYVYNFYK